MNPLYHISRLVMGSLTRVALVALSVLFIGLLHPSKSVAQTHESFDGEASEIRPDSLEPDTVAKACSRMVKVKEKVKHTGSLLYRFIRNFDEYDTLYIAPNYYNYTTMLQSTNYFQSYRIQGKDSEGHVQSIVTKPAPNVKIGPYFGWRWLFLGYTFDVFHPGKSGKSSEFNLSLYSSMLGCDFVYVTNTGDYRLRRATGFEGVDQGAVRNRRFDGIDAKTLSFTAYYVFNHRKFSYPAAYNQSTVQRRSCGSPLLGIGFSKQHLKFDYTRLPEELIGPPDDEKIIEELKFSKIDYNYYYVSGGYGYNWVFMPNFLLGMSVMPSVGVRKIKGEKIRGEEVFMDLKNLSLDCISRAGLVWNNSHWFAGASIISHLFIYNKDRLSVTNSVNYVNVYVGFFFNRKQQYKGYDYKHCRRAGSR